MKSFLLVDFRDSFTWNIYSWLLQSGWQGEVVDYQVFQQTFQKIEAKLIILGPGPGHVEDYSNFISKLQAVIKKDEFFFAGICLGHQLLCKVHGASITPCFRPKHGQSIEIQLPQWKIFPKKFWKKTLAVQVYHSQAVRFRNHPENFKCLKNSSQEVLMAWGEKFLSYQFHPESIGTSYPQAFFEGLTNFFYNRIDGLRECSVERHL